MHTIMVTGAGKIGRLIACMLQGSSEYHIHLIDTDFSSIEVKHLLKEVPGIQTAVLDVKDETALSHYIKTHQIEGVISSLPYFLNPHVAQVCKDCQVHYFDLTEDTSITTMVKGIAKGAQSAFVPQCGLAPGFISIAANSLMQRFDECQHARLRVGAIPERTANGLGYCLTWSTEGLINEYGNLCHAIEGGQLVERAPLEGLEHIQIEGAEYEAFNTSGGLGSLAELYKDKIHQLNYKTIRYPGHCQKMRFLMNELKLNEDRATLKRILERAIPKTMQDLVIIYVSVDGTKHGELCEISYLKKIYPATMYQLDWSAIQVSTAAGMCTVVDLVLCGDKRYHGLVLQESFDLDGVTNNRFGRVFA